MTEVLKSLVDEGIRRQERYTQLLRTKVSAAEKVQARKDVLASLMEIHRTLTHRDVGERIFRLVKETRTANVRGELRGTFALETLAGDSRYVEDFVKEMEAAGFRVEEVK